MLLKDKIDTKREKKIKEFLNAGKKFIFGRNIYTKELINKVKGIEGIIDDFYEGNTWNGFKIFKLEELPKNSYICVVSGGNILTALNRVNFLGFDNVIHYVDLLKYANLHLMDLIFNDNFKKIFDKNKDTFNEIYNILHDYNSKKIYQKIISFRYYYNIEFLKGFKNKEKEQYFESFLNLKDNEVFVDVGGYDGYTSLEFIKRVKNYEKIYFLEPDEINFKKAKKLLKGYKNIEFLNIGAYDKNAILGFSSNDSASAISDDGDWKIRVGKIDDYINEKVTFLKMDIEGAEQKALFGAKNIIKKYRPKMAISIYHSPDDIFKIPKLIFSISEKDKYNIYLRHYTESIYETIMFFIPK